jgi:hypothetical protein
MLLQNITSKLINNVRAKETKMKRKEQPKARNPFVQHLITKKQGAHEKPKKVERQKNKAKLRKEWLGQVAA